MPGGAVHPVRGPGPTSCPGAAPPRPPPAVRTTAAGPGRGPCWGKWWRAPPSPPPEAAPTPGALGRLPPKGVAMTDDNGRWRCAGARSSSPGCLDLISQTGQRRAWSSPKRPQVPPKEEIQNMQKKKMKFKIFAYFRPLSLFDLWGFISHRSFPSAGPFQIFLVRFRFDEK